MVRVYQYVGPAEIKERASPAPPGVRIESVGALEERIRSTKQQADVAGLVAVTFVVDEDGFLRVGDRRSEHVGGDVLPRDREWPSANASVLPQPVRPPAPHLETGAAAAEIPDGGDNPA
jgi:hypothetical protein